MATAKIEPAESKWARTQLGLSQKQVADATADAEFPITIGRLKTFEAGYIRPSEDFAAALRDFYEEQGANFDDYGMQAGDDTQGAGSKAAKGKDAPTPRGKAPQGPRPAWYFSRSLSEEEISAWSDRVNAGQDRIREILATEYRRSPFIGGPNAETETLQQELVNLLALDSLMFHTLSGDVPGGLTPKALGKREPKTLADYARDFFAQADTTRDETQNDSATDDDAPDAEDEIAARPTKRKGSSSGLLIDF